MRKTKFARFLSLFLSVVLIAAIALCMTGCKGQGIEQPASEPTTEGKTDSPRIVKGEGSVVFEFDAVDVDGTTAAFEIHTDETTVGNALQALGLIEGEEGQFGLYVKTVNGITHEYGVDGKYWAFYVNGEYAMKGVDSTPIAAGESYVLKAE